MALTRAWTRTLMLAGMAAGLAPAPALAEPPAADTDALALPPPKSFVGGLDLECFSTPGQALNLQVQLTHLNPVLRALGLPAHAVVIRELVQTCVPVAKNGVSPSADALPFIQHVDFACFRVDAAALQPTQTLTLAHLNPVLQQFPRHQLTMLAPSQLCLPVGKNGVSPPPEVRRVVSFLDLECYRSEVGAHPAFSVTLKQLNPQLGNIPAHQMNLVSTPRQLCVPVQKNQQQIPTDVLNLVQWVDVEQFASAQPIALPGVNVTLDHLNPLFSTLPRIPVTLKTAIGLMVPVSKNGQNPP